MSSPNLAKTTPGSTAVGNSTKERIYAAAESVFVKRGYTGATMNDIAKSAGVPVGNVYYYFKNKEELFLCILTERIERMCDRLRETAATEAPIVDRLRHSVGELVRGAIQSPAPAMQGGIQDILRTVSPEGAKRITDARGHYEAVFRSLVEEGARAGIVKVADTQLAAFAIMGMATSANRWFRPSGRLSLEEVIAIYSKFALEILGIQDE